MSRKLLPWTREWRDQLAVDLRARAANGKPTGERWLATAGGAALLLALVLFLSDGLHTGFLTLNAFGPHLSPVIWQHITFAGDGLFATVIFLLFARRYPHVVWAGVVTAIIATLFTQAVKHGLSVGRPPSVFDRGDFHLVGRGYRSKSFPSGHTATALTVVYLWIHHVRSVSLRIVLLAAGLFIGFSRVFIGVHWPIDVLVSAGAVAFAVWLGTALSRRWQWGLRPTGHLIIVGLLSICALALFGHDGDYPAALWLANATAAVTLALVLWDYVLQPWRSQRNATQKTTSECPKAVR